MNNTDVSDLVSFCLQRQCFVFSSEEMAQTFFETFGALLLLEPVIRVDKGLYCVAVEPLIEAFDGE